MASALDFLRASQNRDGGWGYRVGAMSFVEPTAAVLLTSRDANPRARDFLLGLQHRDGGWGIAALDDESGWMTAWAVWALARTGDARDAVTRGVAWLLEVEVLRFTDPGARDKTNELLRIDASLRGWPWQSGDASWVQPTALAMLALNAAGQGAHPRVREGEQYLRDRAIARGGWNVGNPWMIGKPVPATIQDTAIALLALRAVGESDREPHIANAIQFMRDTFITLNTPAELAWASWALDNWRLEIGNWMLEVENARARLNELQQADGSWQGNPFIAAIALRAIGR
ncbi:MAG: hypothetical protein HY868_19515 [Chloroflexi bacterium]|nr:hypothetical protein [Chloroflexota bacterium]